MRFHYCKSHKGIALEFGIDDNSTDYSLQEIIYTKKPQNRKLEDFKDSLFPRSCFIQRVTYGLTKKKYGCYKWDQRIYLQRNYLNIVLIPTS